MDMRINIFDNRITQKDISILSETYSKRDYHLTSIRMIQVIGKFIQIIIAWAHKLKLTIPQFLSSLKTFLSILFIHRLK